MLAQAGYAMPNRFKAVRTCEDSLPVVPGKEQHGSPLLQDLNFLRQKVLGLIDEQRVI
jgi:hypothetical protein